MTKALKRPDWFIMTFKTLSFCICNDSINLFQSTSIENQITLYFVLFLFYEFIFHLTANGYEVVNTIISPSNRDLFFTFKISQLCFIKFFFLIR